MYALKQTTGQVMLCRKEGCPASLAIKLQELLQASFNDASIGIWLQLFPDDIVSWMARLSSNDRKKYGKEILELLGYHHHHKDEGENCHGNPLIFAPNPIPDAILEDALALRNYRLSHLPLTPWLAEYKRIIHTPLPKVFENLSFVLSGKLYYLSLDKPTNPDNIGAFVEELTTIRSKAQDTFDQNKARILTLCPKISDLLDEIQDDENFTFTRYVTGINEVEPEHQRRILREKGWKLFLMDSSIKMLQSAGTRLTGAEKPNSLPGLLQQVVTRIKPVNIPKFASRFGHRLEEIIGFLPNIEFETALWLMQSPRVKPELMRIMGKDAFDKLPLY
jgi:hypothetical protein